MAKLTAASISFATCVDSSSALAALSTPPLIRARAKAWHRVAAQRRLVLLALAEHRDRLVLRIMERHAGRSDDVAVCREPVDLRFDQRRAGTGARALDRRADGGVHGQRIAPIDRNARHRVRLRFDGERLAVRGVGVLLLGGRHGVVAVVLHYEDHRQFPQRCNVERLVKCTLFRGAVTEEAVHDLGFLADLRRPGSARRVRNAGAHDTRGAEETALDVGEMHRAAEALAQAVHATVNLGHHGLRIAAENERISVAAIGGERRIAGAEVAQRADDGRLDAVGEVCMAADDTGMLGESALHALFELADAQHLCVDPDLPVGVKCLHAHQIPLTVWRPSVRSTLAPQDPIRVASKVYFPFARG